MALELLSCNSFIFKQTASFAPTAKNATGSLTTARAGYSKTFCADGGQVDANDAFYFPNPRFLFCPFVYELSLSLVSKWRYAKMPNIVWLDAVCYLKCLGAYLGVYDAIL